MRPESPVLHLTRDYPPRINGGLSTAVGQLVAATSPALETRVISFDGWRRGAPRRPIPASPGVFRVAGPDDVDDARRWGIAAAPSLVHLHDPLLFELAAEIAGDRPIVLSLHVLADHQDRLRGLDRPTRAARSAAAAIAGAAAIIAPSADVVDRLRVAAPEAAARIVCVPLAAADTAAARRSAARRAAGDPGSTLLYCGRFSDMSGVDQLGAIAAAIADARPNTELAIAGGLPDNPRSNARWVKRLERELRGPRRITGWLGGAELDRERADAAVLIAPARYATFGMAALEAMLFAIPVVAYRAGGLAELVVDGVTGRVVDPDPAALAAACAALLDDPGQAIRLGLGGRQRALERYNWQDRTVDLLDLYGRILEAVAASR